VYKSLKTYTRHIEFSFSVEEQESA